MYQDLTLMDSPALAHSDFSSLMLPPTFAWTLHLLSVWSVEIKTPQSPPTEFNERDHVFKCFPLTFERLVATYCIWNDHPALSVQQMVLSQDESSLTVQQMIFLVEKSTGFKFDICLITRENPSYQNGSHVKSTWCFLKQCGTLPVFWRIFQWF